MSNEDFTQSLKDFRVIFEPKLNSYLDRRIVDGQTLNQEFVRCLGEIKRITLLPGAKRIRPALAYFGYLIFNSETIPEVFKLGTALELFHSSALIYDDIIDEGMTRRGEPTIEKNYQKYYHNRFGDRHAVNHLAMSSALLAGDLAQTMADSVISSIENPALRQLYFEMAFELVGGQIDDCFGVGLSDLDDLSEENIIKMLKTKSGNYSIQKPLQMGMLLAGASFSDSQFQIMSQMGEQIGLIFQFTDDILGIFGDEYKTGKSNISDVIEGKKTLLMLKTYQNSNTVDKLRIRNILGNKNYHEQEINWLKEQIISTKSLIWLQNYCQELQTNITALATNNLDLNNSGINFVLGLSNYLINRSA